MGENHERICQYKSDVEVHHITPLNEDYDLRLDNDNLICLCRYHHELAEKGQISRDLLKKLACLPPENPPLPFNSKN